MEQSLPIQDEPEGLRQLVYDWDMLLIMNDANHERRTTTDNKAAVLEGIRRCGELGATATYVGLRQELYMAVGFELVFTINFWAKYLES